jgi:hypothetical protein
MLSLEVMALAATWEPTLRAMQSLPEPAMVQAVLRERLLAAPPVEAARGLDLLLHRGVHGHRGAQRALLALALALVEEHLAGADVLRRHLLEAALAEGRAALASILADAPAARTLRPRGRLREICIPERAPLPSIQPDVRRWVVYTRTRRIEELRLHPSARMIERLLRQPWLRLSDVLLIAARRPTSEAIVACVLSSPRWNRYIAVREALVLNPFAPGSITLRLLPTLRLPALLEMRGGGWAHPLVAEAADRLLALRRSDG